MAPTLYMNPVSPAVRSALITAKAIDLQLDEKVVDLSKGEHLKPDYLKINPQHTVPTLVDSDGFTFWDSHAINTYLISKYAKDDSLYPKDLKKRAIIDQRLHFDSGVAFPAIARIAVAVLREGKSNIDEADKESLNQVYSFLEAFLKGNKWMAGDAITVADYNLYATISTANVLVVIDKEKYPGLTTWLMNMEKLPEVGVSKAGLAGYEAFINSKLTSS